jgi:hypothetical protein
MGLLDILNGEQSLQFYGGSGPNNVSSGVSFGQKSIGYPGGALLKKEDTPIIRIPLPDSGVTFKQLNPGLISSLISLGVEGINPEEIENIKKEAGLDFLSDLKEKIRYESKFWGPDVLNRGNLYGLVRASDDVTRLVRYFTNTNTAEGLIFLAKQNLLSRVATGFGSETPVLDAGNALGLLKGGVYLPTSTIAQAAVNGVGGHLLKQGIDPTGLIPKLRLPQYQKINREGKDGNKEHKNRLVKKLKRLSKDKGRDRIIEAYGGGPGSVLGIGRTRIKYATDSSDENPMQTLITRKNLGIGKNNTNFSTWDNEDFNKEKSPKDGKDSIKEDFRKKILPKKSKAEKGKAPEVKFLSASPSYNPDNKKTGNIETRLNYRGGGRPGDVSNYELGKRIIGKTDLIKDQDNINMSSIYKSQTANKEKELKDIIEFRMGIFDNSSIEGDMEIGSVLKNWLHFRVLLDKFSDGYKAGWKSQEYMGRAEKFYRYNSFDRSVSLSFKIVAFTKQELMPLYRKLNYFVSHLAPFYSEAGYMSGNLVQLTVGDWLKEQPGFIDNIKLDIDKESPWEVNLGLDGETEKEGPVVKQVPHMINVSINFTPIHRFNPSIQTLDNDGKDITFGNAAEFDYGDQKYISLEDDEGNDGYNQINEVKQQSNISQNNSVTNKDKFPGSYGLDGNPSYNDLELDLGIQENNTTTETTRTVEGMKVPLKDRISGYFERRKAAKNYVPPLTRARHPRWL